MRATLLDANPDMTAMLVAAFGHVGISLLDGRHRRGHPAGGGARRPR